MGVEYLDDDTAHILAMREGGSAARKTNGQVVNSSGYYGWFQIGVSVKGHKHPEWTDWGGKTSEIGTASYERQLEVARVGWKRYAQQSGASTMAQVYCAWNLGPGSVAWLKANPTKPLSANPTVCKYAMNQAWGAARSMTAAQVLQRCEDYFNKGKTQAWISPTTNPATGKPDEVVPAADNQQGNAATSGGKFGGIITLYLLSNNINPQLTRWTTIYTPNTYSNLFYMPCCCGQNGDDSFISPEGDVGMLETNADVSMLPQCTLGNKQIIFIPLTMS